MDVYGRYDISRVVYGLWTFLNQLQQTSHLLRPFRSPRINEDGHQQAAEEDQGPEPPNRVGKVIQKIHMDFGDDVVFPQWIYIYLHIYIYLSIYIYIYLYQKKKYIYIYKVVSPKL